MQRASVLVIVNNSFKPMKKPLSLALLISAIFLVVFTFTFLLWKRKFPYVGTWVYQASTGAVIKEAISFDSTGACKMEYSNKAWGIYHKDIPCDYTVNGDKATIYYEYKNDYDSSVSRPQALRAQYKNVITPINDGRTLRMDMQEATVTRKQGDRIWQQKYTEFNPEFVLFQKVR